MVEIVSVGHLAHDLLKVAGHEPREPGASTMTPNIAPSDEDYRLGGTGAYVSAVVAKLGARAGLVTRVGPDFLFADKLGDLDIDLRGFHISKNGTTTFENRYDTAGRRTQWLRQKCDPIVLDDVPPPYFNAKAFHIGGLVGEVDPNIAREARSRGILTSLDVQGYCRAFQADGAVHNSPWDDAEAICQHIDVIKADLEEARRVSHGSTVEELMRFFWGCGVSVVLLTMAEEGSFLGYDGNTDFIAAFKPRRTVDPTGAGDSFMAGFLVEYLKTGSPAQAALFASSVASFIVEAEGLSSPADESSARARIAEGITLADNMARTLEEAPS